MGSIRAEDMPATEHASAARISAKAIFGAPAIVLGLLCAMYFITYVDRVNIATAATAIKTDFGLNNTELGRVLGAFGLAYALFLIPVLMFTDLVLIAICLSGAFSVLR
jgi:sugar phosphate permease